MGELSNIKFTTPEYDEIIPSTGETVKVKPFKVGDEKTLMIAAESKDQKQIINALRNVVNKCIVEDVNLAYFDYEYLFLKLRAKSVGEVSTIMATCDNTECGHKNKIDLDLESVKISEVEDIDTVIKLTDDDAIKMKDMPIDESWTIEEDRELFIQKVSDLAFGLDAIERCYSMEEVIERLEIFTEFSFKWEEYSGEESC